MLKPQQTTSSQPIAAHAAALQHASPAHRHHRRSTTTTSRFPLRHHHHSLLTGIAPFSPRSATCRFPDIDRSLITRYRRSHDASHRVHRNIVAQTLPLPPPLRQAADLHQACDRPAYVPALRALMIRLRHYRHCRTIRRTRLRSHQRTVYRWPQRSPRSYDTLAIMR